MAYGYRRFMPMVRGGVTASRRYGSIIYICAWTKNRTVKFKRKKKTLEYNITRAHRYFSAVRRGGTARPIGGPSLFPTANRRRPFVEQVNITYIHSGRSIGGKSRSGGHLRPVTVLFSFSFSLTLVLSLFLSRFLHTSHSALHARRRTIHTELLSPPYCVIAINWSLYSSFDY